MNAPVVLPLWRRMLTRQWSFFWAGIGFGIAQVIFIVTNWWDRAAAGLAASSVPITVTTDLGRMFRAMELGIYNLFALPDFQLYGNSIDGIASGGVFQPGIGWPIVGMMIGGALVVAFEREHRAWVKYSTKMLVLSFIGGVVFSYGTRLAGGCTLNHLLGGLPMMAVNSTFVVLAMAVGGFLAFGIMAKLGLASNFKHQETRGYADGPDRGESALYDPNYHPMRRPIFWISLVFMVAFFGFALWGGLANPESLQHLRNGDMRPFLGSVDHRTWLFIIGALVAGIVGGFAMAKSGFGTECGVVSLETASSMEKNDGKYAAMGVPRITRTLMRGYLPMVGIMASWVVMMVVIWFGWVFLGIPLGFEDGLRNYLTMGSLIGGLLLGMGAVMLIGCEIRSYMRIGMGYLNTWVGFMGFAFGYLPFTLFHDAHNSFFEQTIMIETHKWYHFIFPENVFGQQMVLLAWILLIVAGMVYLIRRGSEQTGVSHSALIGKSTEDLQAEIDRLAGKPGGRIGKTHAPVVVPMPAAG